jgi:peptidoglycan/LPS O-acetylase OafA/YrhL
VTLGTAAWLCSLNGRSGLHKPKYRGDIDGLRGVAVLLVVLYHAWPSEVPGGFVGVDIFFVISGFLISSVVFTSMEAGTFTLKEFWARRIRRLVPALLVVLAASLVAGWFLLLPTELEQLGRHVVAGVLFVSNILLIFEADYFDTGSELKPMLHLWSLGVEEQFYLLFPIVALISLGLRRKFLPIMVMMALASFGLNLVWMNAHPIGNFYTPLTRFWEILAGVILFLMIRKSDEARIDRKVSRIWTVLTNPGFRSVLGFVLLVAAVTLVSDTQPYPGIQALLPVLAAVLLISAGENAFLNTKILSARPLVWIGLISFPLYLWHWPVLSFSRIILGQDPPLWAKVTLIALAVGLSWSTYKWVEKPIRHLRISKSLITTVTSASAMVLTVGLLMSFQQGFPNRSPEMQEAKIASSYFVGPLWEYSNNQLCVERYDYPQWETLPWWFCMTNNNKTPDVVILGNSYANQLYPGLVQNDAFDHLTFLSIGICHPTWQEHPTIPMRCKPQQEYIYDIFLSANEQIRFVILAGMPPKGEWDETYLESLGTSISFFERQGAKVIVFSPHLTLDYHINSCYARPLVPASNDCVESIEMLEIAAQDFQTFSERIQRSNPDVLVFDQNSVFCDFEECRFKTNTGVPLYRDFSHLSEFASIEIGRNFETWVISSLPELLLRGD